MIDLHNYRRFFHRGSPTYRELALFKNNYQFFVVEGACQKALSEVILQKSHGVNLKNQSDCIYILIAFTERGDNIRIISLRKATSREARNYVESQA